MLLSACYYASSHYVPSLQPFTLGRKACRARCPSNLLTATSDSGRRSNRGCDHERLAPKTKLAVERRHRRLDDSCGTSAPACANQTRVAQPPSTVLQSCFFSVLHISGVQVAFSDLTLARSLKAWGYWIPYPLPWSPFLKDLDDSSPCLPICSRCKQRHLLHSSPFHPQFYA